MCLYDYMRKLKGVFFAVSSSCKLMKYQKNFPNVKESHTPYTLHKRIKPKLKPSIYKNQQT